MGSSVIPLNYGQLDQAIATFEGFGKAGTLATVNNNPGNIITGTFATAHGATSASQGFAVFPNAATGLAAQDALVTYYANQGKTIQDLITSWAPPTAQGNSQAATQNYINYVTGNLGVDPTTPIKSTATLGQSPTQSVPSTLNAPLGTGVTPAGSLSPTGTPPLGTQIANGITSGLGSILGNALTANTGLGSIKGFSWGRAGGMILAIIVIAGGIYLFKPVQQVVNTTVKKGVRLATAAA